MNNWKQWLTYPECIPTSITSLLDDIDELLPVIKWADDRYSAISDFIKLAFNSGLITSIETDKIKYAVANNL